MELIYQNTTERWFKRFSKEISFLYNVTEKLRGSATYFKVFFSGSSAKTEDLSSESTHLKLYI